MRIACLVNHYNYGRHAQEAIQSVLDQTHPVDEIIVVDDGSRQEDLEQLRQVCRDAGDKVKLVEKENEGQLSCFQVGLDHSTADILMFLDADDLWKPHYVATIAEMYGEDASLDFIAVNEMRFFQNGKTEVTEKKDLDMGFSIVRSAKDGGRWIGQPTSCMSMRRWVMEAIFPLPFAKHWRTCADEALVHGSSIVGARKILLGEPLVDYRIHGNNNFFGQPHSPYHTLHRGIEILRLANVLRQRHGLPECLAHVAHREFRTITEPRPEDYKDYRRLVSSSRLHFMRKVRIKTALAAWYYLRKKI